MRTTLTIEDDLARQLADLARHTSRPFKAVVNDAIRRGLGNEQPAEPEFQIVPQAGNLRVGIDDRHFNELAWEDDQKGSPPSLAKRDL